MTEITVSRATHPSDDDKICWVITQRSEWPPRPITWVAYTTSDDNWDIASLPESYEDDQNLRPLFTGFHNLEHVLVFLADNDMSLHHNHIIPFAEPHPSPGPLRHIHSFGEWKDVEGLITEGEALKTRKCRGYDFCGKQEYKVVTYFKSETE